MKTLNINLEELRFIFRELGVIIVLGFVLFCFELKSYESPGLDLNFKNRVEIQEELVDITHHAKPPPPPPSIYKSTQLIAIVENDMDVEDDLEINVEADQETVIEDYIPPPVEEEQEEEQEEEMIFVIVESMPSFPGGDEARLKYLGEHIKYPMMAREAGIQGKVFVQFVVETDGSITDVKVIRGIGGGCDEEALRLIKNMPRWNPGLQRNVPVRVRFNMPIHFMLL